MIDLEALDDATAAGSYVVQVCEYPAADKHARKYQVYQLAEAVQQWLQAQRGVRADAIVYGWYGPLVEGDMEVLDDPAETGVYAVSLQPWPNSTPHVREFRICIWRRGAWHDQYGFAKQYGNVIAWVGPFPLPTGVTPGWVKQNEAEEAEDIGL